MSNRKKIFILVTIFFIGLIIGITYFLYRSVHLSPFVGNGTKEAAIFRDYGDLQQHDLEYVGTTKITIEGKVKKPLFLKEKFSGTIDISYFSEQKIVKQFEAKNELVDKNNGMRRITTYQHFLSTSGKPLAGYPVDLRIFFCRDMPNQIMKVSWNRRGDYIYWLVSGITDEEEAKNILEDFFAWPKEDVFDILFY